MAFLRSYIHKCDSGCGAEARMELLTWRNELYGRYCTKHAQSMLTGVIASETAYFRSESERASS